MTIQVDEREDIEEVLLGVFVDSEELELEGGKWTGWDCVERVWRGGWRGMDVELKVEDYVILSYRLD
jgi:hypothetical protein